MYQVWCHWKENLTAFQMKYHSTAVRYEDKGMSSLPRCGMQLRGSIYNVDVFLSKRNLTCSGIFFQKFIRFVFNRLACRFIYTFWLACRYYDKSKYVITVITAVVKITQLWYFNQTNLLVHNYWKTNTSTSKTYLSVDSYFKNKFKVTL